MREILFRGYSKVFKEWLYGRLVVAGADLSNTFCIVKNGDMEMDGHHIRQVSDRPLYVDKESIGEKCFAGQMRNMRITSSFRIKTIRKIEYEDIVQIQARRKSEDVRE